MAEMIHVMASGAKIDADRTERFGAQLDDVYANPFEKKQKAKKMSAAEIKDYVLEKIARIRKRLKKE